MSSCGVWTKCGPLADEDAGKLCVCVGGTVGLEAYMDSAVVSGSWRSILRVTWIDARESLSVTGRTQSHVDRPGLPADDTEMCR